jgi:DNA-binding transcriptional regulator PaaX
MELTDLGRQTLIRAQMEVELSARSRKKWDKRWRMIVFDVPEKYRKSRDKLRATLRSLGFVQLQGSVWVYPYDCEEVVALLKADLRLGASTLYAIVEKIENDGKLREEFGLR